MALAVGVAVAVALTSGGDSGSIVSELTGTAPIPPGTTAPTTGSSPGAATTRPPTTATTGTTPPLSAPPQPVQPTPGNLLANGDFERNLTGWEPSGGGRADRVAIGHSGGWSVRIRPGAAAPEPTDGGTDGGTEGPGLQLAQPVQGRAGGSYRASAWVLATRPGTEAILTLREVGGDGDSADVIGVTLPDAGWHQVAVLHQVQTAGRLTVEASARGLPPGEALLLDQVSVAAQ